MLPDIKIALPLLILLWCVGAVWAFGSPVMLAYPAMWLSVGLLFFIVTRFAGGAADGS